MDMGYYIDALDDARKESDLRAVMVELMMDSERNTADKGQLYEYYLDKSHTLYMEHWRQVVDLK